MISIEQIFDELKLNYDLRSEFEEGVYLKFKKALELIHVKTLSFDEAFIMWSLILKYKPEVFVEIGGQHGHSGIIFYDAIQKYNGTFITIELGKNEENNYSEENIGTLAFLSDDNPNVIKVWGDATKELPKLLDIYNIEMVFHDAAHTWDHVKTCVDLIKNKNVNIIQTCHDCKTGLWNPNELTRLGYICAERPVFDETFNNNNYYYVVYEDKFGLGISIHKDKL
jgi:hypothetical protein